MINSPQAQAPSAHGTGFLWCVTDQHFIITAAEENFLRLFPNSVGQPLASLPGFPPDPVQHVSVDGCRKFIVTVRPYQTMSFAITAIPGAHSYLVTQKDAVTELADDKRLKEILSNLRSGIYLLDADTRLLLANEEGRRLIEQYNESYNPSDKPYFIDLIPVYRKEEFRRMIEFALQGNRKEYEARYTTETGEDMWLFISLVPEKDADNHVTGICITSYDISKRKQDEQAYLKNEQRWKFALEGAGDGLWEFNFQTNESFYSDLYKRMLGYEDNEFHNAEYEWRTRIHPDDLPKVKQIDDEYANGSRSSHAIEYRMKHRNGDYLWVLDRGMIMEKTADGKPIKLIGTQKNITARKLAEHNLEEFRQRFTSFMSNTPSMTWIMDEDNHFRYLNKTYKTSFNLTDDAVGMSVYDIFPKRISDQFVKNNRQVWDTNKPVEAIEEGVGPDGGQQWYHVVKFPLEPENGVRMMGGVALDITQRKKLEEKLAEEEEMKKREIIQAIMNAQEEERKELAYELHDNVNQILTSAKLMLEISMEKQETPQPFVRRSLDYLQEAIQEIRKLSHSLTPGTLRDISLEAAIDELVHNLNGTGKINFEFKRQIAMEVLQLKPEVQVSFLRIAQEQLSNILRHSSATAATITLVATPVKTSLSISDNGCGFDPSTIKRGLGLNNIFNRVAYYNGKIELDTAPGKGCMLYVEIPVPERQNL